MRKDPTDPECLSASFFSFNAIFLLSFEVMLHTNHPYIIYNAKELIIEKNLKHEQETYNIKIRHILNGSYLKNEKSMALDHQFL